MEQCPKCGCYMNFHMTYSCGSPVIYYICPQCKFDTRNYRSVACTSTGGKFYYPLEDDDDDRCD